MTHPPRIAFYAPLKPPDHSRPSGDRQMARMLLAALRHLTEAAFLAGKCFLDRRSERHFLCVAGEHPSPRDDLRQIPLASRGHKPRENRNADLETLAHRAASVSLTCLKARQAHRDWAIRLGSDDTIR